MQERTGIISSGVSNHLLGVIERCSWIGGSASGSIEGGVYDGAISSRVTGYSNPAVMKNRAHMYAFVGLTSGKNCVPS